MHFKKKLYKLTAAEISLIKPKQAAFQWFQENVVLIKLNN